MSDDPSDLGDGSLSARDESDLAHLRHHWLGAYSFHAFYHCGRAVWTAVRCDASDHDPHIEAGSADDLRQLIVADYNDRPVPRAWNP